MPVAIKGSGGGSVTLDAGAAAADTTLTLPNTSGTLLQSGTAVTVAQGGTGAATLTANAVLIGNGTSAVTAVAPSTAGNVLTSTGTAWASSAPTGGAINVQTFTSSGTWTKPAYAAGSRVFIQAWGAGGSGGKRTSGGGGGGGGGGYNERWLTLSQMGATETITIGAGGTGITAANTNGNTGGNSSVGTLITGYGGGGGTGAAVAAGGGGGGGQLGAGGLTTPGIPYIVNTITYGFGCACPPPAFPILTYSILGQPGQVGVFTGGAGGSVVGTASLWGGGGGGSGAGANAGGTSGYGGNGGAGATTASGTAGTQPAGGGGGTTTGTTSGAGGAGQIIITVFPA